MLSQIVNPVPRLFSQAWLARSGSSLTDARNFNGKVQKKIHNKIAMASVKRKSLDESKSSRPEKKQKASIPSSKLLVLRGEEPAFPRGGASILTPLEHKQIQIQATNDVLFEQSTGQKSAAHEFEDEENELDGPAHGNGTAPLKTKRKKKSKKGKSDEVTEDAHVRIERLSYQVGIHGAKTILR